MDLLIIFNDHQKTKQEYTIAAWELLAGFLHLRYQDGTEEYINTTGIFSFSTTVPKG